MTAPAIPPSLALAALWNDLYQRDPALAYHSDRVAWLSTRIAVAAGLGSTDLDTLCWSARLHDYGKLALPPTLWQHGGPLTAPAWALMRRHPVLAADLITATGQPEIAGIVAQHHERPDGAGYPLGLAGSAICYLARILALADSLETICIGRPYQPGRPYATALLLLAGGAGTQWDTDLVDLIRSTWPHHLPAPLTYQPAYAQGAA